MPTLKRNLCLIAALALWAGAHVSAFALTFNLEGLDRYESTNWTPISGWSTVNLQDWRELDFIPVRAEIAGGPGANQLLNIAFPHFTGGVYGFQNLYFISNSPNVSFTSPPVLNADPASSDWSYDLHVTLTGTQKGYVYFYARLAAGAHLNPGSSLHLEGPDLTPLQIHKPRPGPGSPDLAITKVGPATAGPGDVITYTITYTNKAMGTNNAAHGVQIIDNLPPLVSFVSASGGGSMAGNTLSFDIPDLTNRASGFVTYQVRVVANATTGQTFTNNALIVSSEDDASMSDNHSSVKTTVLANRPPVANPDTYATDEDTVLIIAAPGVLANDSDPDGNSISGALVNTTTNGTLSFNANGSFTYAPRPDFNGVDSFKYRATDGSNFSSVVSVTITVRPVNDPPVAVNDAYATPSDAALTITAPGVLANDTDVENNSLSAVLVSNPAHGTLALNVDGSFVYRPSANFSGSDSFTYRASDGSATSGVATVAISVVPNPITIITPPGNQTNCPGGSAVFNVTATGTALTYQWLHDATVLLGQTNRTLTLANISTNDAGSYCVIVNGAAGGPVTICALLVVNQNVFVVTPPASQTNCPSTTAFFGVTATGTGLSYQWYFGGAALNAQTNSTLTLSNVTAANGGVYSIVVSGACGAPVTNSATLFVNQNTAIVTSPAAQTGFIGSNVAFSVSATGTGLTYRWIFNGALIGTNSTLSLSNLTANQAGTYCVIVRGTCGSSITNCTTLTIQNRFPTANDDSYTVAEDSTLIVPAPGILANDSDPDGDVLRAAPLSAVAANGTLTLHADGSFIYTPNPNYAGTDNFQYIALDGRGASSLFATVRITVTPVNDAPVANNDSYTVAEDTMVTITAPGVLMNDSDVDGDLLSAIIVTNPTHGTVALNTNGGFIYRPNTNYNGLDTFSYRASDGSLTSGIATVTLTVTPVNDPPITGIAGDHYSVLEDQMLTVAAPGVLGNDSDVDGDPLTAIFVSAPAHGTVTLNSNGSFVYVPSANYFGPDSFVYVANDGQTNSLPAVVDIAVVPVNDPPSFVSGGDQRVSENAPAQTVPNWASTISPGPANESSQMVTFIVTNDNASLFLVQPSIAPNGTLTYTPTPNTFGVANIHVRARDNGGVANGGVDTSGGVIFKITVNSPPMVRIVSPADGTVLMYPATFSVVADASDPDGAVTNVLFLVNGASFTNVAQSPFYFVMTNAAPGSYQFRAIASDDGGLTATSAVVNVEVISNAVVATGPLVLNHQNGLFEQFVTISNRTSETWLNGVRLFVLKLDGTNRVFNATGTNFSGAPYIDNLAPVAPGSSVNIVVQYYVPNPRTVPNPELIAVPNPFSDGAILRIEKPLSLTQDEFSVEFLSHSGRIYYIQRTEDFVHWKTVGSPMVGTGQRMQWKDNELQGNRFYRILCLR